MATAAQQAEAGRIAESERHMQATMRYGSPPAEDGELWIWDEPAVLRQVSSKGRVRYVANPLAHADGFTPACGAAGDELTITFKLLPPVISLERHAEQVTRTWHDQPMRRA